MSLFDASLFDDAGDGAPDAAVEPQASAGQLDIFGNVVEVVPEPPADDVPAADDAEVTALDVTVADPVPVPVPVVDDADDVVVPEIVPTIDPDDPETDPGDVLNDPAWEPPIEVPVEPPAPVEPEVPVERVPSVDALWARVVGQERAVSQLRAAAMQPVHAYLLVGPPGSGAREAASAFGAALLCSRGGCGACAVCRAAIAGEHPDLVTVERVGASISVDQARDIIRMATRAPATGDRKVLVLVDFHLVTAAGPTLLKVIEEPPPSTVFVILADQVTNDLVTIASRCVQIPFVALGRDAVVAALVAEGVAPDRADEVARVSGGRLDRARLLAADPALAQRVELWQMVPRRLDDTGATVSVITGEVLAMLDAAAVGPLQEVHAAELAAFDERVAAIGGRGSVGARNELVERHKRELKRLRDDELRLGLTVLQHAYRDAVVGAVAAGDDPLARRAAAAIGAIDALVVELPRNPNLTVALWGLLAGLTPLR